MKNINLTEIKELIISTEKSKIYKSGIITEIYNKIFNKNEKPTNCGSCLRTFFLKIKNWYQDELKKQMDNEPEKVMIEDDELIIDSPVTLETVREEITIINKAIENGTIEPDGEESELSNDRLVEVIEDKKSKSKKKK